MRGTTRFGVRFLPIHRGTQSDLSSLYRYVERLSGKSSACRYPLRRRKDERLPLGVVQPTLPGEGCRQIMDGVGAEKEPCPIVAKRLQILSLVELLLRDGVWHLQQQARGRRGRLADNAKWWTYLFSQPYYSGGRSVIYASCMPCYARQHGLPTYGVMSGV